MECADSQARFAGSFWSFSVLIHDFPLVVLLDTSNFIAVWSKNVVNMILIQLYLLRIPVQIGMWVVLADVLCVLKMYFPVAGSRVYVHALH